MNNFPLWSKQNVFGVELWRRTKIHFMSMVREVLLTSRSSFLSSSSFSSSSSLSRNNDSDEAQEELNVIQIFFKILPVF